MIYSEIDTQKALFKFVEGNNNKEVSEVAFQSLDFTMLDDFNIQFKECLFLGCVMSDELRLRLGNDNYIFPKLKVPYNIYPNALYTPDTILGGYELGNPKSYELSLDNIVYKHYLRTGKEARSIKETLARRLHDHSITDALNDFLAQYPEDKIVAIMGGHSLSRSDESYKKIVVISKQLTEQGYLMLSGGGPGAMEATHLGAYLAGMDKGLIDTALDILVKAPHYTDEFWLDCAFQVTNLIAKGPYESLGVPTWLYGHEPPSPFASKMAKYFANSVREDGLLAMAKGGVIFAPGSAGTIQEIFQDATQNHYLSFGYASPMVFMNAEYWNQKRPIYPVLLKMQEEGKYQNLILSIYNDESDIIKEINAFRKNVV